MEHDTTPNPQRFQVFTEIASGKGFKIKNSKYIYFFDKYGGWYDEFNNYYNADGQHEDPPSDEDDDFQRVLLENQFLQGGDDDDYYDKMYGGTHVNDYDEDEGDDLEDQEDDYEPIGSHKPAQTKVEQNNSKKKYFAKTQAQTKKEEPKPVQAQIQSTQKQVKPVPEKQKQEKQEPPKQEKKEDLPTWAKYQAEMTVFPKKESFKEWMLTFGFNETEHFKNLTKVDSKEAKQSGRRFATVELRSDVLDKIQGKQYGIVKVLFEKVK